MFLRFSLLLFMVSRSPPSQLRPQVLMAPATLVMAWVCGWVGMSVGGGGWGGVWVWDGEGRATGT
jgi:hypothetical protein